MAQSQALAAQIARQPVLAIYASPILRAQQTAAIVAEYVGMRVQTTDALREFDCGVMEGRGDAAAWAAHRSVNAAWAAGDTGQCIDGGESLEDLRRRFLPFVQAVVTPFRAAAGTVLLISHGGLLHPMLPLVLTNIDPAWVTHHPLRNCACVTAEPSGEQLVCSDWDGYRLT
jgi:broad specificity phosphatase PhoE